MARTILKCLLCSISVPQAEVEQVVLIRSLGQLQSHQPHISVSARDLKGLRSTCDGVVVMLLLLLPPPGDKGAQRSSKTAARVLHA